MVIYYIFAAVILLVQLMILTESWRNLVYCNRRYRPRPSTYRPRVALICPCKGLDTTFDRNINSLFFLDYPDYEIFFVVENTDDPAHQRINEIIKQNDPNLSQAQAHLIVAGPAQSSSQKVHNLLTACNSLPDDFRTLAFVDSDACVKPHFLTSLVHPLWRQNVGVATGYRWFVPADRRISTAVLSAMNAFFASLMGPHPWNSAWGGAMALRREVFDEIGLAELWQHAFTDDYSLTRAVKKAGLRIAFVPACFVASYEKTSWADLIAFARRQFIITRIGMPRLWVLAVLGIGHFVVAFWAGLFVTLYLLAADSPQAPYAAVLPLALMVMAILKATARQVMIFKILPENRRPLLVPAIIDIFLQPFLAVFTLVCVLSTSFSRVIVWRGIRYILRDADHTEIQNYL